MRYFHMYRNQEVAKIMSRPAAAQAIGRERRKIIPKISEKLSEMAKILEEYSENNDCSYHGHFKSIEDTYGLVFTSKALLDALRDNPQEIYIDGTFDVSQFSDICMKATIH